MIREMSFELALVNPGVRPNEHRNVVVHLSEAEVIEVMLSRCPLVRIADLRDRKFLLALCR